MTTKDELLAEIQELKAANESLHQILDHQQDQIAQMRYVETIERPAVDAQRAEALAREVLWLRGVIERLQGLTEPSSALEEMTAEFRNRSSWSIP